MHAVTDPIADAALLTLFTTDEGRADPYPHYRTIREHAPILRSAAGTLVVTRYEDAIATLRDPRLGRGLVGRMPRRQQSQFPGAADPALRQEYFDGAGDSMLFTDPPEHTRLRQLVSRTFTPKRVESLRPSVVATVSRMLDSIAEKGEVDVMSELAFPLPVSVIGELVGVPEEDRPGFQRLVRAGAAAIEPFVDDDGIRGAIAARDEMGAYFAELLAERRRTPQADLLSGLAETREHDDRLTDREIIATAILLFAAGFETTTNLIGNGLLALLRHPDQFDRLRADPGLSPSAVEELLRWDSPVQVNARSALEPAAIADEPLESGEAVLVLQGAANRDPERFTDPDRLDIGRQDNVPISFGWGAHHCIGAALARMEGDVVFGALATGFSSIEPTTDAVRWRRAITLRGLEALPVRFEAA